MGIVSDIYTKWKHAENDQEAAAYMDCYFMVIDYIQDREHFITQEMRKYYNARVLADKMAKLVKEYEMEDK